MTDQPYTDADVELVAEAIDDAPWPCEHSNPKSTDSCDWWTCPQCQAAAVLDALVAAGRLAAAAVASTEPERPEREEVRWAYRWIGPDGQVYDEMDANDNAIETGEQRAHRIAAKRLTGTVRGEVLRYRVLTMPAEVVATYPAEREG